MCSERQIVFLVDQALPESRSIIDMLKADFVKGEPIYQMQLNLLGAIFSAVLGGEPSAIGKQAPDNPDNI